MKYEDILNKILEINQKFERCDKENTSELYFEMLHSYLIEILSACTEEQYNNLTKPFRETIKKFEDKLLDCCSMTYCENYQDYIKEHGLFMKLSEENPHDRIKTITKCKRRIGFELEKEEGTTI